MKSVYKFFARPFGLSALLLLALAVGLSFAEQNPALAVAPVAPTYTIPPVFTRTATPTATLAATATAPAPTGSLIVLQVTTPLSPTLLLTVVQWQDGLGAWHDVEGWRGQLQGDGRVVWWVAPKDFGTGPFRWVTQKPNHSQPLALSEKFWLPSQAGVVLTVQVKTAP